MMHWNKYPMLLSLMPLMGCQTDKDRQEDTQEDPNIIVIMADDMGYADLGYTGAEYIQTPNLDQLAENGVMLDQFYNTSRSCPTRASLLTGQYAHRVGMGWMTASNLGREGYIGDLNDHNVTIAEVLKNEGYANYISGKWHVTHNDYLKQDASKHNWPLQRGFDKYFGMLAGGGGYYHPKTLCYGNKLIDPPEDFYLTEAITDSTVAFLDQHFRQNKDQPLFCYVAHYAPHRPLHAPEKYVKPYRGKFKIGWDSLRKMRYQNQLEKGIIDEQWALSERGEGIPPWNSLSEEEKIIWDARMAVYAGQITSMDQGVGKIVQTLKAHNELDETLILFLEDNGGCEESQGTETTVEEVQHLGQEEPFQSYHKHWANASNVPFRYYKSFTYEGGISTPLIAHWPQKIENKGAIIDQRGHVIDLLPTFMDITGASYPDTYKGKSVYPSQGVSLLPALQGNSFKRGPLFFEHEATRAAIKGEWKLVSKEPPKGEDMGPWELYNLEEDRSETHNLIEQHPEKAEMLKRMWYMWAQENNVLPLDNRGWGDRIKADVNEEQ